MDAFEASTVMWTVSPYVTRVGTAAMPTPTSICLTWKVRSEPARGYRFHETWPLASLLGTSSPTAWLTRRMESGMMPDVLTWRNEGTTTSSVPLPSSMWNRKSPFTVAVSRISAFRTLTSAASRRPPSAVAASPVPTSTGVGMRAALTST